MSSLYLDGPAGPVVARVHDAVHAVVGGQHVPVADECSTAAPEVHHPGILVGGGHGPAADTASRRDILHAAVAGSRGTALGLEQNGAMKYNF